MKKVLKKLSCALLAAAMVCAMTPLAASAAINYSKTRIVYMPTSGKDLGYDEISISNIPAKQNILKSNVKVVSGGSVIALDSFGLLRFQWLQKYHGGFPQGCKTVHSLRSFLQYRFCR